MELPRPDDAPADAKLSPATLAVTLGRPHGTGAPVTPPLTLTSTYQLRPGATEEGDPVYARVVNPTWTAFEETLGALDGGDALVFAAGMGAIRATLALVPIGGVVVAPQVEYQGTTGLLSELEASGHVAVRWVDIADTDAVLAALPGAAMLWIESPTNPLLDVADVPALIAAAHGAGALVAVDATFATPIGMRPLSLGADVTVHSVTKFLGGHSDVILGATVTTDDALFAKLHAYRTSHGVIPGPTEVWLALRGVRTLALRVERSCDNAADLARRLQDHPAVARVRHPSLPDDPGHARAKEHMDTFGAVVTIELVGEAAAAERLCSSTRLWVNATSLGGVESLIERRRRYTTESPRIPESHLRLSVGIEDVEDLWADLSQALDAIG